MDDLRKCEGRRKAALLFLVHDDIAALESLGQVARDASENVTVPFESVEIRLCLADAAA